jgi:hypothetical protein
MRTVRRTITEQIWRLTWDPLTNTLLAFIYEYFHAGNRILRLSVEDGSKREEIMTPDYISGICVSPKNGQIYCRGMSGLWEYSSTWHVLHQSDFDMGVTAIDYRNSIYGFDYSHVAAVNLETGKTTR